MPVSVPKRRHAFHPIGKLRGGSYGGGKKHGMMASLNLTPMVDMFTVLVIFLLQLFSATGDILFTPEGLKLPPAKESEIFEDVGTAVVLYKNEVIMDGKAIARVDELDEAESGIPALSEALRGIRERDEKLFGRAETEAFEGKMIIQADKETDFLLVRKAIFSANEAGWAHLNFMVVGDKPPALATEEE